MGITPAHAGTTDLDQLVTAVTQDHPRSRGDHLTWAPSSMPSNGSPPLTRGPLTGVLRSPLCVWITPAHAGTTTIRWMNPDSSRDHPRSRGDHRGETNVFYADRGSPPLTRGPLSISPECPLESRITPAHAGTTGVSTPRGILTSDHPRSRGDHSWPSSTKTMTSGSPPLTRGPLVEVFAQLLGARITPAHAGTTYGRSSFPALCLDHPRSRGDHSCERLSNPV